MEGAMFNWLSGRIRTITANWQARKAGSVVRYGRAQITDQADTAPHPIPREAARFGRIHGRRGRAKATNGEAAERSGAKLAIPMAVASAASLEHLSLAVLAPLGIGRGGRWRLFRNRRPVRAECGRSGRGTLLARQSAGRSARDVRRGREAEEPIDGEPCGAVKPAQLRSQALAGSAKRAFDGSVSDVSCSK